MPLLPHTVPPPPHPWEAQEDLSVQWNLPWSNSLPFQGEKAEKLNAFSCWERNLRGPCASRQVLNPWSDKMCLLKGWSLCSLLGAMVSRPLPPGPTPASSWRPAQLEATSSWTSFWMNSNLLQISQKVWNEFDDTDLSPLGRRQWDRPTSILSSAHLQEASCPRDRGLPGRSVGQRFSTRGGNGYICHGGDPCSLGHLDMFWGRVPPTWLIHLSRCSIKVSVLFSHSVMSDSLQPHGLQHVRPPCPSPTPRVYSNSYPLSRWCHPAVSASVVPFSSCLQSFPASGSFQMSQLFTSGGQSIGVSASTSVLPMNIQDWFPLGWTGWISLPSKGLSRVFSNTTLQKHQFFGAQPSL